MCYCSNKEIESPGCFKWMTITLRKVIVESRNSFTSAFPWKHSNVSSEEKMNKFVHFVGVNL